MRAGLSALVQLVTVLGVLFLVWSPLLIFAFMAGGIDIDAVASIVASVSR